MATPETQQGQMPDAYRVAADLTVPATEGRHDAGGNAGKTWFNDFERIEKVFFVLLGLSLAAALVAYVGFWTERNAVILAGTLVLGAMLFGMAVLFVVLNWVLAKAFLAWRRHRAAERRQ